MLTLFSIPKPFEGHVGTIQRNAIRSWTALPGCQVLLVGDEPGAEEAARNADVQHVGGVATNEYGTPRLDDAFRRVEAVAHQPLRCFLNADIVVVDDFLPTVSAVRAAAAEFLIVGETIDLDVDAELELSRRAVRDELAARAQSGGCSRGATAIDYFVFTPGLFDPVPEFAVGRARFDNWLVWRARQRGIVVDASEAVVAVHQHHDYAHLRGGLKEAHFGAEADRNLELGGGKQRLYTINDASYRLAPDGRLRRNFGAIGRMRENRRKIAWKLARR
jgi:hypothetical protein